MRRPPLTKKVLAGLIQFVAHYEAGAEDDFFGYSTEQMRRSPDLMDLLKDVDEVRRACEWVRGMQAWYVWKESPRPIIEEEGQRHAFLSCSSCSEAAQADGKGSWLCPKCGATIALKERTA